VPIAKQAATLDHLSEGRLIFGVGIGGEFPKEFEACGVPLSERGARLSAAIPLLRQLWRGGPVSYSGRHFGAFSEVSMQPPARQPGGPPIWVGGRADAALARAGRLADGWISYVVTPETYRAGLETIAAAAEAAGRRIDHFGTGHLLFARLDASYEQALDAAAATLSHRYAMDFRRAAERYAALGRPEQVAERIRAFHEAGVRHLVLDLVGPYEERPKQIETFARDVLPLLADLR
jgi:alkanesulfonate monooxygenase SsuD/methylene tetrahydromethanopterin reductase-like flavin-dependent oxidoreductase (luciferase family)